ncbi:MAG: YciI family protein [Pseudomonadota bacterium]
MWYLIVGTDVPDSLSKRRGVRAAHLERLRELTNDGKLLVAGPFPAVDSSDPGDAGFTGSAIIAEFDSLDAAQRWAQADPYVSAGVYASVVVKPFLAVLP